MADKKKTENYTVVQINSDFDPAKMDDPQPKTDDSKSKSHESAKPTLESLEEGKKKEMVDSLQSYSDMKAQFFVSSLPHSLYGNGILTCITDLVYDGTLVTTLVSFLFVNWSLVLCFLLQGTLLGYLGYSLPNITEDASGMCPTDIKFQLALIAAFMISLYQPACDILFELYVVLYCTTYFNENSTQTAKTNEIRKNKWALFIALIVIFMETTIFVVIVIIGTKYILTSRGASNLIQSALSIVFIAEIDDQIAKVTLPAGFGNDNKFVCKLWIPPGKAVITKENTAAYAIAAYSPYIRPVIFVLIVVGIVVGLKFTYC